MVRIETQMLREVLQKMLQHIDLIIELAYERDWKRSITLVRELEQKIGIAVYLNEIPRDEYPALEVYNAIPETGGNLIARLYPDGDNYIEIRKHWDKIEVYPRRYLNLLKDR